jgi:exodeoxyribonuclease VII large subunit
MLNPQRTLERGYAVIMSKNEEALHAVRKPSELNTENVFQLHLADGSAQVQFVDIQISSENS